MKHWGKHIKISIAFLALSGVSAAADTGAKWSMKVTGTTSAPIGFIRFCSVHPKDCLMQDRRAKPVVLTKKRWREIRGVNDQVNRSIRPVTDADLYGVKEHWTYPNGSGDCEDYVILKRRMLIERGWPASSLLITVVRDTRGDGHAVLTARTDRGDFILDNQDKKIKRWDQTPYRYIKRQSQFDAFRWAEIVDRRTRFVGSIR